MRQKAAGRGFVCLLSFNILDSRSHGLIRNKTQCIGSMQQHSTLACVTPERRQKLLGASYWMRMPHPGQEPPRGARRRKQKDKDCGTPQSAIKREVRSTKITTKLYQFHTGIRGSQG
jgi:hypothetical protein